MGGIALKLRIGDFVIAAAVIALAACIWLVPSGGDNADFARISIDGEPVKTLDLRSDSRHSFGNLKVQIKDNAICVVDSDCADKVCVNTGWISKPGQSCVCLPNRISIEIIGQSDVDAVAGG